MEKTPHVVVLLVNASRTKATKVEATELSDLRAVAIDRLDLPVNENGVKYFENIDGTEVDEEEYLLNLEANTTIMVCREREKWTPEYKKADWSSPDSSGDECDRGPSIDCGINKQEDQEDYVKIINCLKANDGSAQPSGGDVPDGCQPQTKLSIENLALLCESDPQLLAQHVGLKPEEGESLQRRLQKHLYQLEEKEELRQLEELIKRSEEKKDSTAAESWQPEQVTSMKRQADTTDIGTPAKRSRSSDSSDSGLSPP